MLSVLVMACSSAPAEREASPSLGMPAPGADVDNVEEMVVTPAASGFSNDLRELLTLGRSAKCEFSTPDGTVTMYMDGTRQRIEMMAQGTDAYTISDGVWLYSWSGTQGVKYELAAMKQMAEDLADDYPSTPQAPNTAADYADTAANVRCSAWTPSGDSFTPPSNVEFQDMAALLQQMQQYQGQMPDY